MRLLVLLAALALPVGLVADDKKEPAKTTVKKDEKKVKDEEAILGTWKIESIDYGDPKVKSEWGDQLSKVTLTFKKDGTTVSRYPKQDWVDWWLGSWGDGHGKYKLDPSISPKAIDLGSEKEPILALYELNGDTLTLCEAQWSEDPRPKAIKADAKAGTSVITLKRVKDEKKKDK